MSNSSQPSRLRRKGGQTLTLHLDIAVRHHVVRGLLRVLLEPEARPQLAAAVGGAPHLVREVRVAGHVGGVGARVQPADDDGLDAAVGEGRLVEGEGRGVGGRDEVDGELGRAVADVLVDEGVAGDVARGEGACVGGGPGERVGGAPGVSVRLGVPELVSGWLGVSLCWWCLGRETGGEEVTGRIRRGASRTTSRTSLQLLKNGEVSDHFDIFACSGIAYYRCQCR